MQTLLPHCSLVTVNSITLSNLKCWLVLERLSELGSSLIICFLTHKQPCPLCSQYSWQQPSLWVVSCQHCTACVCSCHGQLHSYFAIGIYFPQHFLCCKEHHSTAMSWGKGEAQRERCPNQGHTHRDQTKAVQESYILTSTVPLCGVLNQETFHIGTLILVLPVLPQTSLSVRNILSSILQNQSLNFYLNLDSAVCNTSDENSKLC